MRECCRFGHKADGIALLQEWVRDVGSKAGLTSGNTSLSTGNNIECVMAACLSASILMHLLSFACAISCVCVDILVHRVVGTGACGVPESRLELEVSFESMADWERFLASVPAKEHKAWGQRIQSMVDGSPTWHVYRSLPVEAAAEPSPTTLRAPEVLPSTASVGQQPLKAPEPPRSPQQSTDLWTEDLLFSPDFLKEASELPLGGMQGFNGGTVIV